MDDGYFVENGYYFSTDSFTRDDQQLLVDALRSRFGLSASIHKYGETHRLFIMGSCREQFISQVKPYILPEFEYKLTRVENK